jgi:hypothetical protein
LNQHSEEWVSPGSQQGLFDPRRIGRLQLKQNLPIDPNKGIENMTLTEALDPSTAGPASRYVLEHQPVSLSDVVEQLAGLRFAIVLSVRWEKSGCLSGSARTELQSELRQLRSRYSDKIDEIAMHYGVQAAMVAQEGVEREVTVPKIMAPLHSENTGLHDI